MLRFTIYAAYTIVIGQSLSLSCANYGFVVAGFDQKMLNFTSFLGMSCTRDRLPESLDKWRGRESAEHAVLRYIGIANLDGFSHHQGAKAKTTKPNASFDSNSLHETPCLDWNAYCKSF